MRPSYFFILRYELSRLFLAPAPPISSPEPTPLCLCLASGSSGLWLLSSPDFFRRPAAAGAAAPFASQAFKGSRPRCWPCFIRDPVKHRGAAALLLLLAPASNAASLFSCLTIASAALRKLRLPRFLVPPSLVSNLPPLSSKQKLLHAPQFQELAEFRASDALPHILVQKARCLLSWLPVMSSLTGTEK